MEREKTHTPLPYGAEKGVFLMTGSRVAQANQMYLPGLPVVIVERGAIHKEELGFERSVA